MPNSPSAPSSAGASNAVSRGTVLIADDDPEILTLLSIRLSKRGYTVLEAADGLQTLQVARRSHPDLVLLDVMMPGKNGWEVARELRGDQALSDIGIVMLTAIGEKVNEMTSPLYGADDYIDKPFNFEELERKIAAVIEHRRKERGSDNPRRR
ncbi:MAG: response regulator [Myxococcales bacterium]|nr:response regulator [Myxococcales bacterium]